MMVFDGVNRHKQELQQARRRSGPVMILLQAIVKGAAGQFSQDRITGTSLTLGIGIVFEDRVLKLPFDPIELRVG